MRIGYFAMDAARRAGAAMGAGLIVLGVAGCVSAPPRQAPPEGVSARERWEAGGSTNAVLASWWNSFGSEPVAALVAEALTRNYDLQAAWARLEAAAAEARIAGAERYPGFSGGLDAGRSKRNFIGFPIPGTEGGILSTRNDSFGVNLAVAWELDLWGRIRAGSRAAVAELQASQADYRALQQSIAAQTVKAWLAAVESRRQIDVSQATVNVFERTARQVGRRYERGLAPALDYRLALADLESGRAALAEREALRERAARQLELLLGRYPDGASGVETDFPTLVPEIPAGLPSELLVRRPDVIAAERRLASSVQRVAQARAALYPRISLTGSGGTSTDDLADLLNQDFSVWALAANAAQPLFQGGRLRAGIDLAKARNRELAALYVSSLQRAFGEVETALAIEQSLAKRESSLRDALRETRGALAQAEARYAAGLTDVLSVLQAQRSVFAVESQLIGIQRERVENRVNLHLALGGGFGAPSAPAANERLDSSVQAISLSR